MFTKEAHTAPSRPRTLTPMLLEVAASELAQTLLQVGQNNGHTQAAISQALQRVNPPVCADGYVLARRLDDEEGWICSTDLVDSLDAWSAIAKRHLQTLEQQWAEQNDLSADLPPETRVMIIGGRETGTIDGPAPHMVASYLVALDGDPNAAPPMNRRRVIGAELVRPLG